jgi:hypothetical protein
MYSSQADRRLLRPSDFSDQSGPYLATMSPAIGSRSVKPVMATGPDHD